VFTKNFMSLFFALIFFPFPTKFSHLGFGGLGACSSHFSSSDISSERQLFQAPCNMHAAASEFPIPLLPLLLKTIQKVTLKEEARID
jgi:hypothetical protein